MKKLQRILAMLLALLMLALCPASALAEEANTPKEEVVYIRLQSDGTVKEIHVVNIFDLSQDGTILDYGDYAELRNMTTTDPIAYADGAVRIQAKAGKLYYEGRLTGNAMPWNIRIRYFLDGAEYPAGEIAGKSGRFELRLSIAQNPDCDSSFFDGYALQASITLNTELAANITAEGATIANVGKNKQLTYMILPHTEKEISVTADVKDFEMSAISINGIRMNLDMHIDADGITAKVDEITGAVRSLNTGAAKLNTGAGVLHALSGNVNAAASALHSGVATLDTGAGELKAGLDTLVAQNDELTAAAWTAYEGLCSAAETQLNAQLAACGLDAVTLTPATYDAVLSDVLAQLDTEAVRDRATQISAAVEQSSATAAQLSALKTQLDDYGAFYNGLVAYVTGTAAAADDTSELAGGLDTLYANTASLTSSVNTLHTAVGTLRDGIASLKSGTQTFADQTADLNTEVGNQIDTMVTSMLGSDVETKSFASGKNVNIQSVQFVLQTEAIETVAPVESVAPEEEPLSFWQKLLNLF